MEIKIDRDIILKCLNHIQGVVEKKNTLPILANVLIEAFDNKIQISAEICILLSNASINTLARIGRVFFFSTTPWI